MSALPVSADTYFSDFEMDVISCTVVRHGNNIGAYDCIPNQETEKYVHIRLNDNPDIVVGDNITLDDEIYAVTKIKYDTYEGAKELMKVFY